MMLPFPIHWHIVGCLSVSLRTGRGAGLSQTETPYSTLTNEGYVSLNKTLTFCDTTPGFLMKWHLRRLSAEIPHWWHVTFQICIVLLIGWSKFSTQYDQSEALPKSGWWQVFSMEFQRFFLRRHFAGKPVVASLNTACCLMLGVRNFSY